MGQPATLHFSDAETCFKRRVRVLGKKSNSWFGPIRKTLDGFREAMADGTCRVRHQTRESTTGRKGYALFRYYIAGICAVHKVVDFSDSRGHGL